MIMIVKKILDLRRAPQQQQKKEQRGGEGGEGKGEREGECKRGRRWSRRRLQPDQVREEAWPWMKRRGFLRKCQSPSSASLSLSSVIVALARTSACPSATTTFSRASASSLSTSTHEVSRDHTLRGY